MSLPAAPVISGDLSGYSPDEGVCAALHAAAVQAKEMHQHFLGMEHVLHAILEHEKGEGPGHAMLRTLNVDTAFLRLTIAELARRATAYGVPQMVSLRSDSRAVLKLANELRKRRGEALTHAGHAVEALLCNGNGPAARAVCFHMDMDAEAVSKLPLRLRRGLDITGLMLGLAWEFPETEADQLGRILYLERWDIRHGPFGCRQPGMWDQLECHLYRRGKRLRLLLAPTSLTTRPGRWLCMRLLRRKSAAVAVATGAQRVSVARFFREWPRTLQDHAGCVNREFFVSRKSVGRIRPLTEADGPFCRELYALLEERRQVPLGFSDSLEEWLQEPHNLRLVIELDGELAGCGALWMAEEPDPMDAEKPPLRLGGLSFGLVHPRFQRYGLGSTLLAFRMAAIHRLGGSVCRVEGTDCSVPYLERIGFRFWHRWDFPNGERLFSGAAVLTDEDADVLEGWLGAEHAALLGSLEPAPLRKLEEAAG